MVPAFAAWLYLRKRNPDGAKAALAVFFAVAAAGLLADVIKYFAGRMRPVLFLKEGLYGFEFLKYKYEYVSFPSGHTADVFGAACVLAMKYKKYLWLFMLFAVLIGLSRIVTLHHYLSDVMAGSLTGYAAALVVYKKMFNGRWI